MSSSNTAMNGGNDGTLNNQNQLNEGKEENRRTSQFNLTEFDCFGIEDRLLLRFHLFLEKQFSGRVTVSSALRWLFFFVILFLYMFMEYYSYCAGIDSAFPSIFATCAWLFALYGVLKNNDRFFIPLMLFIGCDLVLRYVCVVFVLSFLMNECYPSLNEFLFDYWPAKAQKFVELNQYDLILYLININFTSFIAVWILGLYFNYCITQRYVMGLSTPEENQQPHVSQNSLFTALPSSYQISSQEKLESNDIFSNNKLFNVSIAMPSLSSSIHRHHEENQIE